MSDEVLREATDVHAIAEPETTVIWGCDMEEEQPQFLIRELATVNPSDLSLRQMVELTKNGSDRKVAPPIA